MKYVKIANTVQYIFFTNGYSFISGLCSLLTEWPTGSAVSVLSCKMNAQGSSPTMANFLLHLTFNLIIVFHWSVRVSRVRVQL